MKLRSRAALQKLRAHKWIMVSFCAAIAMVLGAVSVGASVFVWSRLQAKTTPRPVAVATMPSGEVEAPAGSDIHQSEMSRPISTLPGPDQSLETASPPVRSQHPRTPTVLPLGDRPIPPKVQFPATVPEGEWAYESPPPHAVPVRDIVYGVVDNLCLFVKNSSCKPSLN